MTRVLGMLSLLIALGCSSPPTEYQLAPKVNRVVWLPSEGRRLIATTFTDGTHVPLLVEDGVRNATVELLADGAWEIEWATDTGGSYVMIRPEGDAFQLSSTDGSSTERHPVGDPLPSSGVLLKANGEFEVVDLAGHEGELQGRKHMRD